MDIEQSKKTSSAYQGQVFTFAVLKRGR
jgi:hypothetical protein